MGFVVTSPRGCIKIIFNDGRILFSNRTANAMHAVGELRSGPLVECAKRLLVNPQMSLFEPNSDKDSATFLQCKSDTDLTLTLFNKGRVCSIAEPLCTAFTDITIERDIAPFAEIVYLITTLFVFPDSDITLIPRDFAYTNSNAFREVIQKIKNERFRSSKEDDF